MTIPLLNYTDINTRLDASISANSAYLIGSTTSSSPLSLVWDTETSSFEITYTFLKSQSDVTATNYYSNDPLVSGQEFDTVINSSDNNYISAIEDRYSALLAHYNPNDRFMRFADVAKITLDLLQKSPLDSQRNQFMIQ